MSDYAMHYRSVSGVRHTHHIRACSMQAAWDSACDIAEKVGVRVGGFAVEGLAAA